MISLYLWTQSNTKNDWRSTHLYLLCHMTIGQQEVTCFCLFFVVLRLLLRRDDVFFIDSSFSTRATNSEPRLNDCLPGVLSNNVFFTFTSSFSSDVLSFLFLSGVWGATRRLLSSPNPKSFKALLYFLFKSCIFWTFFSRIVLRSWSLSTFCCSDEFCFVNTMIHPFWTRHSFFTSRTLRTTVETLLPTLTYVSMIVNCSENTWRKRHLLYIQFGVVNEKNTTRKRQLLPNVFGVCVVNVVVILFWKYKK